MLPIYTRYLSPEDYGAVAMMMLVVTVVELAAGMRFFQAVPKFYAEADAAQKRRILSTSVLVTGSVSMAAYCLFFVLAPWLSELVLHSDQFALEMRLFLVILIGLGLEDYGMLYLRLQDRALSYVGISLLRLVLQLGLNIWLVVYLEMGVAGVAWASASVSLLFGAGFSAYILRKNGLGLDFQYARRALRFCWPLWLTGFAGLYIGSASKFFLSELGTLEAVGIYELATKFAMILMLLFWEPFNQFWSIERFELYKLENRSQVFSIVFSLLLALLCLVAVGISCFGVPVIALMSDPAFHDASKVLPWLVFGNVFIAVGVFFSFNFVIVEKTLWIARVAYFSAIFMSVAFWLLIPLYGFIGAGIATMVGGVIRAAVLYVFGRQHFDMAIDMKRSVLSVMIAAVCVCLFQQWFAGGTLLGMLLGAMLCSLLAAVCLLALMYSRPEVREYATVQYQQRFARRNSPGE